MPSRYSASWLLSLPQAEQTAFLASLTPKEAATLNFSWEFWARENQLPPVGMAWVVWLVLAGRGFGKTRTGAEYVRSQIERGICKRMALVAPTASDARDVMVEGESGILAVSPPWFRPVYEPSKRRLTWPNGSIATTYSADEPERLRGPQHDGAWCDELAVWRYPSAWDMLMFGLRLGPEPHAVVTTTPKPGKLLREIMAAPTTVISRGTTYANLANLSPTFLTQVVARYEGTRLGRQELNAELLEDNPDALWKRGLIEDLRVTKAPRLKRIVVAVDPPASSTGAECGIIVGGLGEDGHGYILDDRSLQGSPNQWATAAVAAYHTYSADRLVAEQNNGGEMVETTVRTVDKNVAYKGVHASRGKQTRAEPVAALYEQHKVHHVGAFAHLEDQMCLWTPGEQSPDRMDALVWLITELMLNGNLAGDIVEHYRQLAEKAAEKATNNNA